MLGQLFTELFECCVGMLVDEPAHFLFVGSQFLFSSRSIGSGRNGTGLSTLLEKRIDPRAADFVVSDKVFNGNAGVEILQNPFAQIKGIGGRHKSRPGKKQSPREKYKIPTIMSRENRKAV
jgi:hypothetical protein